MRIKEGSVPVSGVLRLAATSGFSQSAPSHQQQVEEHTRKAQEYLRENKPDLAVPEFKAIVALEPNNVDARGNLGVLLSFQGAYAEAIPQLRAALKLQQALWKIQALLGMAEKRTGDIKSALGDLETAFPELKEQKIRIETGMELIDTYSKAGDLEKAAATVSVLRELDPTNVEIVYTAYRIYSDLVRGVDDRSEEHTSELQSPDHLVCRLLLEKKNRSSTRPCRRHRP